MSFLRHEKSIDPMWGWENAGAGVAPTPALIGLAEFQLAIPWRVALQVEFLFRGYTRVGLTSSSPTPPKDSQINALSQLQALHITPPARFRHCTTRMRSNAIEAGVLDGRVARAILMQQSLDLFGKAEMTLMNKGTDYHAALNVEISHLRIGFLKIISTKIFCGVEARQS